LTFTTSAQYGCSMLNIEGETVWSHLSNGWCAWTVRTDTSKVYYSSDKDVIALDFATGKELWRRPVDWSISFGVLYGMNLVTLSYYRPTLVEGWHLYYQDKVLYVSENGISGVPTNETVCNIYFDNAISPLPSSLSSQDPIVKYRYSSSFSACTANEEHVFGGWTTLSKARYMLLFRSDHPLGDNKIVIYDRKTTNLIKTLHLSSGQIMSMQIHNNRLYIVTGWVCQTYEFILILFFFILIANRSFECITLDNTSQKTTSVCISPPIFLLVHILLNNRFFIFRLISLLMLLQQVSFISTEQP